MAASCVSLFSPYLSKSTYCSRYKLLFLRSCQGTLLQKKSKSRKVPEKPVYKSINESQLPPKTIISKEMIEHLERISLVDFANKAGIRRLEDAIRLADELSVIDTTNVEPLTSVLEDRMLYLREDQVTEGGCQKDILSNASISEEDYFVAPPGNIPLVGETDYFEENVALKPKLKGHEDKKKKEKLSSS